MVTGLPLSVPRGAVRFCLGLVIAFVGLGLGGCLDYSEEIWFEADGQSRVEISAGYSNVATRILGESDFGLQFRQRFDELETYARTELGARSVHISEYVEGRRSYTKFATTLPSAQAVERLMQYAHESSDGGPGQNDSVRTANTVRITPAFGGRLRYEQDLSIRIRDYQQTVSSAEGAIAQSVVALALADAQFRVRLHGAEVIDAIGESRVDMQMVEWTVPMVELIRDGGIERSLSAEMRIRPPYEWWALTGIVALLGLLLLRRLIGNLF